MYRLYRHSSVHQPADATADQHADDARPHLYYTAAGYWAVASSEADACAARPRPLMLSTARGLATPVHSAWRVYESLAWHPAPAFTVEDVSKEFTGRKVQFKRTNEAREFGLRARCTRISGTTVLLYFPSLSVVVPRVCAQQSPRCGT
jgi:hypothetical protein